MRGIKRGPKRRDKIARPKTKRVRLVDPINKYSPKHMAGNEGDLTRTYLNPAGPICLSLKNRERNQPRKV